MANAQIGDVWRSTIRSSYLGQPVINTIHLITTVVGGVVDNRYVGQSLAILVTPLQTFLTQACSEQFVMLERQAQLVRGLGEVYGTQTHLTYRSFINEPGTYSGQEMPGQSTGTVSVYGEIGGTKAIHGGIRIAGISESAIEEALFLESYISEINAEMQAMYQNVWELTGVGPSIEDVSLEPIIFSRTYWKEGTHSPQFAAVDSVQLRRVPGTLRRRKQFSSTGGYTY